MRKYYILIILILLNIGLKAQNTAIITRHLQSSKALNASRGFQETEIISLEHNDEINDTFIKIFVEDLYDDEAIEELSKFLEFHKIGRTMKPYEEYILDADITIKGTRGYYDILKTQDWSGGSLIIKEGITDIETLKKSVFAYVQGKQLKEATIKGSESIFSFKLIHVEYDTGSGKVTTLNNTGHNNIFQVIPNEDYAVLEVTNHSTTPISIEIFEINTAGEINNFFPNENCNLSQSELTIAPLSTVRYEHCAFSFSPPYETLTLKAIAKLKRTDETNNAKKTFLYTSELEYEVVTKKTDLFEDIITQHAAISTALVSSRGATNMYDPLNLRPDNKPRIYKMNFAAFQNKEHSESDILKFIHSYTKNVGLCIYTYIEDKLNVVLYTKDGKAYDQSFPITKEKLIDDINIVNQYFSSRSLHRSPILRGSNPTQTSTKLKNAAKHLHTIRELLLPPSEFLDGIEHLIVVPTLNIATLPFYTLQLSEQQYLVDRMSYSIAPGLIELLFKVDSNNPYQRKTSGAVQYHFRNALLVANPTFSTHDKWAFPSLPGTEQEVDSIVSSIGERNCTVLKGDEATQEKVLSNFRYADADLLYFATHGIADPEDPLDNSFLALAGSDDTYFTARTIQHLEITANLVILSACQTGLGQTHDGGVIGLARAFQLAGANNVLSSLWNIDDKETVTMMTDFFGNIQKGGELMPHEALRQAILKYKNDINKDPYYWSAFMIFGVPY